MNESTSTQSRTELHTHFMGMLTSNEFFKFIMKYTDYIYWPISRVEDGDSQYIESKYLVNNKEAIEALSIPLGEKREYKEGLGIYRNRSNVIAFVIKRYALINGIDEKEAQYLIYNDYFNRCLRELINNGIYYAEISFSNEDLIEHFKVDDDIKNKIKYNFLICTQRTNKVGSAMQEKIKRAYDNGVAIGFDFMGMETPLDEAELNKTGRKSYYKKLDAVLEVLVKCPNSVLRIHSGEAEGTEHNSERIFYIIDEIKCDRGYGDFPPPEFRIGHGIHYHKSKFYYEFLRRNHAIVEINAISNVALSNIKSLDDLPYIDYLDHGIPIAISTDGHGVYNTATILEDKIAYLNFLKSHVPEGYDILLKWENAYLEKKVRK